MNKGMCVVCDGKTEFVEIATGEESTVETTPSEVGNGWVELRWCQECGRGLEYVLEPSSVTVVGGSDE